MKWAPALLLGLLALWTGLTAVQWQLFQGARGRSFVETLVVFGLVNLNILLLLLLLFLVLRNLTKLAFERKKGILGAKLKTKLVLAFLATTLLPATVLFLASAGFLAKSIDGWFSTRVEQSLGHAMEVARTYYKVEQQQALSLARVIAELAHDLETKRADKAGEKILEMTKNGNISSVSVFFPERDPIRFIADSSAPRPRIVGPDIPEVAAALAGEEAAGLLEVVEGDFIRASAPINTETGGAVLVEKYLPGRLMYKLQEITIGFEEYSQLQLFKAPIKVSYILPLLLVALLITFAATWFGLYLARGITEPISELADATQRVAGGDLHFQLSVKAQDEVGTLVDSFNSMTRNLEQSKAQVEEAQRRLEISNEELSEWRQYMEIVMEKVAAVVISTDHEGRITTFNSAAREIFGVDDEVVGLDYRKVLPEETAPLVESLFGDLIKSRNDTLRRQLTLPIGGLLRTVAVHLTTLRDEGGNPIGTVAVLNDLSDLVSAQRAKAWQEVARRIAHEIKNPLTPIQLSAQRLRRKYRELIENVEGEVLDEATGTIIGQVDQLKQLVDEFSRYSKMPETKPEAHDLNTLVEEVCNLYRPTYPKVQFLVTLDQAMATVEIDEKQVKRALVNLLDNAMAALEHIEHPQVEVTTSHDPVRGRALLAVADNGKGLKGEARGRLFEPYFSTKEGGTGLGLAIVKSIMGDHRGDARAMANRPQGTRIVLEFPLPGAEV